MLATNAHPNRSKSISIRHVLWLLVFLEQQMSSTFRVTLLKHHNKNHKANALQDTFDSIQETTCFYTVRCPQGGCIIDCSLLRCEVCVYIRQNLRGIVSIGQEQVPSSSMRNGDCVQLVSKRLPLTHASAGPLKPSMSMSTVLTCQSRMCATAAATACAMLSLVAPCRGPL
jgi:hypothetical protein